MDAVVTKWYVMSILTLEKVLVMSVISLLDPPSVSAEVDAMSIQLGVCSELQRVIAMTRALFPVNHVQIVVEDDPEVPSDPHLAIVVQCDFDDVDQLVASQWKWHERLFECCPAPLTSTFRLVTESRP